jgi:hypothetical protein
MKLNFRCLISAKSMGLIGGLEMSRADTHTGHFGRGDADFFQEDFFRRRTDPMMRERMIRVAMRMGVGERW